MLQGRNASVRFYAELTFTGAYSRPEKKPMEALIDEAKALLNERIEAGNRSYPRMLGMVTYLCGNSARSDLDRTITHAWDLAHELTTGDADRALETWWTVLSVLKKRADGLTRIDSLKAAIKQMAEDTCPNSQDARNRMSRYLITVAERDADPNAELSKMMEIWRKTCAFWPDVTESQKTELAICIARKGEDASRVRRWVNANGRATNDDCEGCESISGPEKYESLLQVLREDCRISEFG